MDNTTVKADVEKLNEEEVTTLRIASHCLSNNCRLSMAVRQEYIMKAWVVLSRYIHLSTITDLPKWIQDLPTHKGS